MIDITPYLAQLRPAAGLRGKAYYAALRALKAQHGTAMAQEIAAYKAARWQNHGQRGVTTREIVRVILRHRLTLAAGFDILEDVGAVSAGIYDRIRRSIYQGKPFRVGALLQDCIAADGWPDAAPEVTP